MLRPKLHFEGGLFFLESFPLKMSFVSVNVDLFTFTKKKLLKKVFIFCLVINVRKFKI